MDSSETQKKMLKVVLVVDDDPLLSMVIRDCVLIDPRLMLLVARNEAQAMSILTSEAPDAMVLDLLLTPPESGLDVLKAMHRTGVRVPTLVLTALDEPWAVQRSLDEGADLVMAKPFDPDELTRAVLELLGLRQGS